MSIPHKKFNLIHIDNTWGRRRPGPASRSSPLAGSVSQVNVVNMMAHAEGYCEELLSSQLQGGAMKEALAMHLVLKYRAENKNGNKNVAYPNYGTQYKSHSI